MVRGKRRSGVWHHRVPDFKLVYCGPNERISKEEYYVTSEEKCLKNSIIKNQDAKASMILK
jgi:hypothetical protein